MTDMPDTEHRLWPQPSTYKRMDDRIIELEGDVKRLAIENLYLRNRLGLGIAQCYAGTPSANELISWAQGLRHDYHEHLTVGPSEKAAARQRREESGR